MVSIHWEDIKNGSCYFERVTQTTTTTTTTITATAAAAAAAAAAILPRPPQGLLVFKIVPS
jgi:hypothetical protein